MEDNSREHILIVDDEASIRDILARALEHDGYDCNTAADVDSALELIDSTDFSLVISDIMMPGRTGIELLTWIVEKHPDTKVVMVTALADTETAIKALKLGAYDYLTKPFNIEEVSISVRRALEKRRLELIGLKYQEHLEQKVGEQTEALRSNFFGAITSLAQALDEKDRYTHGHSERVTEIAMILGREMGLTRKELERVELAGRVHDIGKIGVSENILNKTGKLTNDEFDVIKKHSEIGERILSPIVKDKEVLSIVRHHHEKFDGLGFPNGLAGNEIPFGARLLAVADAFDAMTSDRPYRLAMSYEKARRQLEMCRGSQFDPDIVDVFICIGVKLFSCPLPSSKGAAAPHGS